jgi:hypothetical protein
MMEWASIPHITEEELIHSWARKGQLDSLLPRNKSEAAAVTK